MVSVVTIAGSPSSPSRSAAVLEFSRSYLLQKGISSASIIVRDLNAEDLIRGHYDSASIRSAAALIQEAQGIVIATPVYKAAYSGVLKTFLDLLPQAALAEKVVLPIAMGGSLAHLLVLDYALKPVLSALGAGHVLGGLYLVDSQAQMAEGGTLVLEPAAEQRLLQSLDHLSLLLGVQAH
jgi:FMN reductase